MGINRLILFVLAGIIMVGVVSAVFHQQFDFGVEVDTSQFPNPFSNPYATDKVDLIASVTPSVGYGCKLICKSITQDFGPYDINGAQGIPDGESKDFGYQIRASGPLGIKQFTLDVSCGRSGEGWNCAESDDADWITHSYGPYQFEFDYAGDGQCTTEREKCDDYLNYTKDLACDICSTSAPKKECLPDSIRGTDGYGCATYCGNGAVESQFEDCNSCSKDVGFCKGYNGCNSGNECEDGFCVHGICWDKSWSEEDGLCTEEDKSNGENCKNSEDCACKDGEECNAGICEKQETSEEEITEAIRSGVQETSRASQEKTKNVTLWAVGLIVLFIVGYLIYKFSKDKKTDKKESSKEEKKSITEPQHKKKRIVELEKSIKEREKVLKEVRKEHAKKK